MVSNKEMLQDMAMVYRMIYKNSENGSLHRNTLKNLLLKKGKVQSKTRFMSALENLVKQGDVKVDHENVSLNPQKVKQGVLKKGKDKFFVNLAEAPNKNIPVDKRDAMGYRPGDLVDVVFANVDGMKNTVLLGRSSKQLDFVQAENKQKEEKQISNQENKQKAPISEPEKEIKFNVPQSNDEDVLLGRVVKLNHNDLVFIPNKKNLDCRRIPITNKEDLSKFQDHICVMRLLNKQTPLIGGEIIQVKGEAGNPIHEYDAIAENYGAIMSWETPELQKEIEKIPESVDVSKLNLISEEQAKISHRGGIVDLRDLPFATIDPADCKDMDDAICSTFDEHGNYVCWTAVANVTKYVDLDTNIGQNYIDGSFTIYAPNKAYGILPNQLSNGICSLNPNEDRRAFVVKTVFDKTTGQEISNNIYDAVIRSQAKYSYEQAQEVVDQMKPYVSRADIFEKVMSKEPLSQDMQLLMNYYSAEAIKAGFKKRRMIRFNSRNEYDVQFDEDMKDIVDINAQKHLPYHEVIEAFMIAANEDTAKYLQNHKLDGIFRVHDQPNQKKTSRANEFFELLGIEIGDSLSAQNINDILAMVKGDVTEETVNQFLIKMQSRAVYSDRLYSKEQIQNHEEFNFPLISHFALQSEHYSHTTAPIRRVVDYVTHFNILADIHGTSPIPKNIISEIIDHANQRQIEIDQAEKDFADVNSVIYCEKHIGDVMNGYISKFRYSGTEEGYDDEIVAIVKNEDKGICVEIPLSQIVGARGKYCTLSSQGCAVYDQKGNVALKLCSPVEFQIVKADRKTMNIVGRSTKILSNSSNRGSQKVSHSHHNHEFVAKNKNESVERYDRRHKNKFNGSHKREEEHEREF